MNHGSAESRTKVVRVNLMLTDELNEWIDEQLRALRQSSAKKFTRSEIVRAGLSALREAPFSPAKIAAHFAADGDGRGLEDQVTEVHRSVWQLARKKSTIL